MAQVKEHGGGGEERNKSVSFLPLPLPPLSFFVLGLSLLRNQAKWKRLPRRLSCLRLLSGDDALMVQSFDAWEYALLINQPLRRFVRFAAVIKGFCRLGVAWRIRRHVEPANREERHKNENSGLCGKNEYLKQPKEFLCVILNVKVVKIYFLMVLEDHRVEKSNWFEFAVVQYLTWTSNFCGRLKQYCLLFSGIGAFLCHRFYYFHSQLC